MDEVVSPNPNTLELAPPISFISSQSETATPTQSSAPLKTSKNFNADSEDMVSDCHHETVTTQHVITMKVPIPHRMCPCMLFQIN